MRFLSNIERWSAIPLADPTEQRLAPLLQILLGGTVLAMILTAPIFLIVLSATASATLVGAQAFAAVFIAIALITLRNGRFQRAVTLAIMGLLIALALMFPALGLHASTPFLLVFMFPISLAALLTGPRMTAIVVAFGIAVLAYTALGEFLDLSIMAQVDLTDDFSGLMAAVFVGLAPVIGFFLARFGSTLRGALNASVFREGELAQLSASLETTIAERTAALQEALRTVEQREARLAQTLDGLRESQEIIRELSAPIIPMLPGVLVVPLIGALDNARANMLTSNVLRAVELQKARYLILDITGVPIVDTQVAGVLIQMASALRFLGAQVLLVGIRPEVAQTMITLGIDLQTFVTYSDLQEAVAGLLSTNQSMTH